MHPYPCYKSADATTLGRMVTYLDALLSIKLDDTLSSLGLIKLRDELKSLYL